jgi:hypothetical protein
MEHHIHLIFEVLMMTIMKATVFLDVMVCSVVDSFRDFEGTCFPCFWVKEKAIWEETRGGTGKGGVKH